MTCNDGANLKSVFISYIIRMMKGKRFCPVVLCEYYAVSIGYVLHFDIWECLKRNFKMVICCIRIKISRF